ncbi:MAG TPA: GNAT family N-acetyltransferase [candidate division Zixibacteria bacterium]|nr:GNAT family N-acetyltransferase [candidate division Zixibacteria bacterium]
MNQPVVRILKPDDLPALEAFLTSRLDSSLFLISNSRQVGVVDHGARYEGTYAAAFSGEEVLAVTAHYWNGMLIVQAPQFLKEVIAEARRHSARELKGLIGLDEQVQLAKQYLAVDRAEYQIDEADGLYSLLLTELAVPEQISSGQVAGRRLMSFDLDRVTAWRVAYSVELLGIVENQQLWEQSRSNMEDNVQSGQSWVLEDGGRIVANTSFNAAVKEAVQVGGVYTPPEFRGRGYGRCVVAASLLDARESGVETAVLFTGDANIPARKAYAALGFKRIGDYRLSILKEPVG